MSMNHNDIECRDLDFGPPCCSGDKQPPAAPSKSNPFLASPEEVDAFIAQAKQDIERERVAAEAAERVADATIEDAAHVIRVRLEQAGITVDGVIRIHARCGEQPVIIEL